MFSRIKSFIQNKIKKIKKNVRYIKLFEGFFKKDVIDNIINNIKNGNYSNLKKAGEIYENGFRYYYKLTVDNKKMIVKLNNDFDSDYYYIIYDSVRINLKESKIEKLYNFLSKTFGRVKSDELVVIHKKFSF